MMQSRRKWTTKDFGFFLLIATAVFIIALMLFTTQEMRPVTASRIEDCEARLATIANKFDYTEMITVSRKVGPLNVQTILGAHKQRVSSMKQYSDRISMLENREMVYSVSLFFIVCLLLVGAFFQNIKSASFERVTSPGAKAKTYRYYPFFSTPLCAVCLLLTIGVTYRFIFSWETFDFLMLVSSVAIGIIAFLVYRKTPYIAARLAKKDLPNTNLTCGDVWFLLPAAGVLLLLIVNILFGVTINGAKLWVNFFGISIQPGEFIKVLLAILFATAYGKLWRAITAFSVSAISILGLLFLRDMGTAIVIFSMVMVMLFLLLDNKMTFSLYKHKYLLIIVSVMAVCLFFVALSLFPYAKERFDQRGGAMTNPGQEQQAAMLKALVLGGLGGLGLENSTHIINIFAIENDMALAGLTAVFGYGMLLIVSLCYALLVVIPLRKHAVYREFYFVSAQIAVVLTVQVLLNALGAVDILPFTGIVAPFISDGGSALMSFCAMMGILLATLHPAIKPLEVNS